MASLGRIARRQALSSASISRSIRTTRPALASRCPVSHGSPHSRPFHNTAPVAMKAGRVTSWGQPPKYMDVPDLPAPTDSQIQLRVLAAGVPPVVLARAAGLHFTAHDQPLPYDPGLDGIGRDEQSGDLYFIPSLAASVLSQHVNVDRTQAIALHSSDLDPVAMAALVSSVQSSWMALRARVTAPVWGPQGRPVADPLHGTVAILGVTSRSGRCAARVARHLGAKTVVGLATADVSTVDGLDLAVPFTEGEPIELPEALGPVHIVLDYVGGDAGIQLLKAAEADPVANLQYVLMGAGNGGTAARGSLSVPGELLNMKPIRVMGSGAGSWNRADMRREMAAMAGAMAAIGKPPFEYFTAPLSDIEAVWASEDTKTKRLVLVP